MQIFLNILLFLVALSLLILLHELGHFSTAKLFKVYCADFSVGLGPAIFRVKRKKGETYFSLRWIPLGGFVAMAGEEGELEEGLDIPKERSIAGIAKWKAAIIMSAGIAVNFIIALPILYIANIGFTQYQAIGQGFRVEKDSIAEKAGFNTFDKENRNSTSIFLIGEGKEDHKDSIYVSYNVLAYYENSDTPTKAVAVIKNTDVTPKDSSYDHIQYYEIDQEVLKDPKKGYYSADYNKPINANSKDANGNPLKYVVLNIASFQDVEKEHKHDDTYFCTGCGKQITDKEQLIAKDVLNDKGEKIGEEYYHKNCEAPNWAVRESEDKIVPSGKIIYGYLKADVKPMTVNVISEQNLPAFEKIGLSVFIDAVNFNHQQAWEQTAADYSYYSTAIFKAIGGLFTGSSWNQMGGAIAMFSQANIVMSNFGFGQFLKYCGMISINLGIFNLLPFPGLDGWQLCVIGAEGITRRKVPDKFKAIMSYVGFALLGILMLVLIIKDIFMLVV